MPRASIKVVDSDLVALPKQLPDGPIWLFPTKVKDLNPAGTTADACIDQFAWAMLISVITRQVRAAAEKQAVKKKASRIILGRKKELKKKQPR